MLAQNMGAEGPGGGTNQIITNQGNDNDNDLISEQVAFTVLNSLFNVIRLPPRMGT